MVIQFIVVLMNHVFVFGRWFGKKQFGDLDLEHHAILQQRQEISDQLEDLESQYRESRNEVSRLTDKLAESESQRQEYSDRCERLTIDVKSSGG